MLLSILAHLGHDHGAHHAVPVLIAVAGATVAAARKALAARRARRERSAS